ncbi:MAG TPA: DUF2336 domain-containing protein [Bradyrhizobium sp.]|nr:DUF2336 domain-containing protein [Bradyrhizobium sp.]
MTMLHSLIHDVQDAPGSGSTRRQLRALKRITDLFLAGSASYSKRQVELFDEVFKVLVEAIELQTRIKLAHRLATDPAAPAVLVRAVAANDDIAVAGPVLRESPVLTEPDLVASASKQSQNHLLAIAQREAVSEVITDILIERGEQQVVHAVAKNAGAQISDDGFSELVMRAGADVELALHVGTRRDIPRHHFLKLLDTASASVCGRLVAANPTLAEVVQETVTEVIDDINGEVRRHSPAHTKARFRIRRLSEWKELREVDVHAGARAQDFEKTVTALAALAGCGIEVAERAVLNENPGAVQIIAKAAGCSWATAKALLLMTVAERKMSKMDLERARENFEQLERRTAQRVLEFYEARRQTFTNAGATITSGEAARLEAMMG